MTGAITRMVKREPAQLIERVVVAFRQEDKVRIKGLNLGNKRRGLPCVRTASLDIPVYNSHSA